MDRILGLLNNLKGAVPSGGGGKVPPVPKAAGGALAALALVAGGGVTFYNSLFDVDGGHRALIFNRFGGLSTEILKEGTHIAVPWFQLPVIFDVKTRPNQFTSKTGSKDLQMVDITIRVLTKPQISQLPVIYTRLGLDKDQDARVLPSVVPEVLKAVVAKYNAAQLITQREQISMEIKTQLSEEMNNFQIDLADVSLTNISFGAEYNAAVERKQIAQQDAEKAKFVVDKAEQTRKSRVIQAKAEAKSVELISVAMQDNPGYLELKRIDAARKVAQVMAKSPNRVYLNADNLLFNLGAEAMATNSELLQNDLTKKPLAAQ